MAEYLRSHSYGELDDTDSAYTRGDIVTQLVNEYKEAEHQHGNQNI